jgi:amino-acid N-acetyltransferase
VLRRDRLLLMVTRRAKLQDWPAVEALLSESGLPLEGAARAFATGVVSTEGERLVGCAAIEPYDGSALLRSVAVEAAHRGTGVGTELVHEAEDLARAGGATRLILLTDTAEPWFGRLGYEVIDRSTVPADMARSVEFETACSDSAVAMHRKLTDQQ